MDESLPLEIDCQSVANRLGTDAELLLVDCREEDEHALARIAAARLLPMSVLADRVSELEPYRDRQLVVHCHHGGRSLRVARWLREQGFKAQSMTGGIDAWSQQIDASVPRY